MMNQFRPIPFYFVTTTDSEELSFESVCTSLRRLKEEGFGGLVLFNKPPYGFDADSYLSKEWFVMVRNFAEAAKELQLKLWINDGFNYPPGDVGGRINREQYPELTQKRLRLTDDEVIVEEVEWGFPAFEEPKSAELFHQYVYEAYLREVGEYFGNPIIGFFSDADNRRVNARVFRADSPQKDYFPWSTGFAESFEQEYGYNINPYLKKILKKESCTQAADYWEHAGRLYQSWFASNYHWCREHGLEYTFHTSDSSPFTWKQAPRSSAFTEGRALDMESNSDYPGTDQELLEINGGKHLRKEEYWVPRVSWGGDDAHARNPEYRKVYGDLRAKQAGSTAFLYHKKGAMCEMFAATNWGATPTQLREIATWQIMQGITFIVPHAYHHRLLGTTKYFAPPIYSPHSTLNHSAKQVNDLLAQYCYYASMGRLIAPIAVLDITDDVWEGRTDSEDYFAVCETLNRMPYGYVLADVKSIVANKEEFAVIINAGALLQGKRKEELSTLNIPIIEPSELYKLEELIDCKVRYEGEGQPHFMRRRLDDGREMVIVASVEDDEEIRGVLTVGNTRIPVTLQTGEMAFFTEKGRIEAPELLECQGDAIEIIGKAKVLWEDENMIPLEYWEDTDGNPICKNSEEKIRTFRYSVRDAEVEDLKLMIPRSVKDNLTYIRVDDVLLTEVQDIMVFDEPYCCYELSQGISIGEHYIMMEMTATIAMTDRIFLQGEFGVEISCEGDYAQQCGRQYCMNRYIPEHADVVMTKRQDALDLSQSWTKQGHPFYSGKATYVLDLDLPQDFGEAVLHIPEVHHGCIVEVDGTEIGNLALKPYIFVLGDMSGVHTLHLTVYNSMANAMECYQAPSGITDGICIYKKG